MASSWHRLAAVSLGLTIAVALGQSATGCADDEESTGCPAREPSFSGSEECTSEGLECSYGQECCCGSCYSSYECTCRSGIWSCYYTDACYGVQCGGSGGAGASGGAGGNGGAAGGPPSGGSGGSAGSGGAAGAGGSAGAGGMAGAAGSAGGGGTAGAGGSAGGGGSAGAGGPSGGAGG